MAQYNGETDARMRADNSGGIVTLPEGASELLVLSVHFTTGPHSILQRNVQAGAQVQESTGRKRKQKSTHPKDEYNNAKERFNWMRYYCTPFCEGGRTAIGVTCDTKKGGKRVVLRVLLQGVDALGPNEENCCPITLDKFENSEVDFLPGECIIKKHPNLCIGVLPCGHKCSAVPLLFHMLVSGVKCPMCRQGPDQSMRSRCIPPHLREAMLKEEARIRREELQQQNRDSRLLVQQMMAEMRQDGYNIYRMFPPEYTMSIFFYTTGALLPQTNEENSTDNTGRAVYSTEYPLHQITSSDFQMEAINIRQLNDHLTSLGCTSARFITHCRDANDEQVVVSNSGMFEISQLMGYSHESPATFVIESSNRGEFILSRARPVVQPYGNTPPVVLDNVLFRQG